MLQDPHIRYPICNDKKSFSIYIEECQKIINNFGRDSIANGPFELKPEKFDGECGALLIHGLLDSPFIMRDMGEYLSARGILVKSILLPGHATIPGSLLNIRYEDWAVTLSSAISNLKLEAKKIFLLGYSLGTTLSIHEALENNSISGIIGISPAIKIKSSFDFMSNYHSLISWAFERYRWLNINEEIDTTKYASMPLNAVYQVYKLTRKIKNKKINTPLFFAISSDDEIISYKAALKFFKAQTNSHNQMIIYTNKLLAPNDYRVTIRKSEFPNLRIQNFSHIALPVAPTNSHYGKNGDYPLASHLEMNKTYGALKKNIERLTFNPDFDFMMERIFKFIQNGCG